jgi:serine/threonine protein kinase
LMKTKTNKPYEREFSEPSKLTSGHHQKIGAYKMSSFNSQSLHLEVNNKKDHEDSDGQTGHHENDIQEINSRVVHQIRPVNKGVIVQNLYSEEGDGSIFIETDKISGKKQLITVVDISTLYKEKRMKSVTLAKRYASISHNNLIEVKKLYITKKMLYFEMEAPENTGSWKSFCKRKFSTIDILVIFRQICSALEHLHKNHIVHRDVHPTRIHFLNGFAKFNHIGMPYNYKKLLKKENFSGHINYSAPELILEDPDFDDKVDIWSLGCCLYYLYTKNDPFEGKTPAIIKKNILNESITKGKTGIDQIIQELLSSCLVVNCEDRPNATRLLKIQNDLEYKYYGECVSRTSSNYNKTENGRYAIYGSPQATYKVYNNNYLPPASIKNRKSYEYKKQPDTQQEDSNEFDEGHSKPNQSNIHTSEKEDSVTLDEDQSPEKAAEVLTLETQDILDGAPPAIEDDASIAIKLDEDKAWHDYSLFNDDDACDYSWIGKKYRLELESFDNSSSRRCSYNFSEENEDDSCNTSSMNSNNWSFDNQEKHFEGTSSRCMGNPTNQKLTKVGENLINNISSVGKFDQHYYLESNKSMFVGEAIKHGNGILFDKDPDTCQTLPYKGEFKYDLRDGPGQQSYKDGTVYNGSWKNDKPHGVGVLLFSDGQTYEGNFHEGYSRNDEIEINAIGSTISIRRLNDIEESNFIKVPMSSIKNKNGKVEFSQNDISS